MFFHPVNCDFQRANCATLFGEYSLSFITFKFPESKFTHSPQPYFAVILQRRSILTL